MRQAKLHRCWLWEYEIFKPSAHVTQLYDKSRQAVSWRHCMHGSTKHPFHAPGICLKRAAPPTTISTPVVNEFHILRKVTRTYDTCHVLPVETGLTRTCAFSQWNSKSLCFWYQHLLTLLSCAAQSLQVTVQVNHILYYLH